MDLEKYRIYYRTPVGMDNPDLLVSAQQDWGKGDSLSARSFVDAVLRDPEFSDFAGPFGLTGFIQNDPSDSMGNPSILKVRELSDSTVSQLEASNPSKKSVCIRPGAVFSGGNQNRTPAEVTVILPESLRTLNVNCIELGRWNGSSSNLNLNNQLPAMIRYHSFGNDQQTLWDEIYNGLVHANLVNDTLNGAYQIRKDSDVELPVPEAEPITGAYHINDRTGISFLTVDRTGFSPLQLTRELSWQSAVMNNPCPMEYFRIFSQKERIAVRCTPQGKPLFDSVHKQSPVVFRYSNEDLEFSFLPPFEKPPSVIANLPGIHPLIENLPDLIEVMRDSRMQIRRLAEESFSLNIFHPEFKVRGIGLIYRKQPVMIDMIALP